MPQNKKKSIKEKPLDITEETRECPICGKMLKRPYWKHLQKKHTKEYHENKTTWIQLYKDYTAMGMSMDMSLKVISELFNVSEKEIKSLLKKQKIL